MITPATQLSLVNAKAYFREHLRTGDYYSEEKQVAGEWFGAGAHRLGLAGLVTEADFLALCEGIKPGTDEWLTARQNTVRTGENGSHQPNRRVLYDWVMRPPKSVSIVGLVEDSRIIDAHNEAVKIALAELELFAQTRVRRSGESADRDTGNIVAAIFRHDTSREQDPLIHSHCVIFNATFDETETRWKALQNKGMLRAQKLASAVYDQELVKRLKGLGYDISQVRDQWEIKGVSREMVEQFSKRRTEILEAARAEMKEAGLDVDEFALRDRIARDQRKRKIRDASPEELKRKWKEELGHDGQAAVRRTRGTPKEVEKANVAEAGKWARDLVFERQVACSIPEMEAAIMRRILGEEFSRSEVKAVATGPAVSRVEGTDRIVSHEAWARETEILEIARQGRDAHAPLVTKGFELREGMDDGQSKVFDIIGGSRDTVSLLIGDAGVGKSFTLKRIHDAVIASGRKVFVTAPQGVQARGLSAEGMPAETLSKFLARDILPHGAVVFLDEAGQVGGKDMRNLLRRVDQVGGRVVLCGDTKQHGAVAASDAMKVLQGYGELPMARLTEIRRQDPAKGRDEAEKAKIVDYKTAVQLAAKGETIESLRKVMDMGAVHEVGAAEKVAVVGEAYAQRTAEGEDVLVVSQTRKEVAELNVEITERLAREGRITNVQDVRSFVSRDLLHAEKSEANSYATGQFVVFNRRYGSIEKGTVLAVNHVWADSLALRNEATGQLHRVSFKHADVWDSLEKRDLRVGDGSVLMMRRNGLSRNGREYSNGERLTVEQVWPDLIRTRNERGEEVTLDRENLVANLGYAVTSYASQGKTVDRVLIVDSGSVGAENKKEWYVSLSRGRRAAEVFTVEVNGFASRIKKDGERELAVSIAGEKPGVARAVEARKFTPIERTARRAMRVVAWARENVRRAEQRARHIFVQRNEIGIRR